MSDSRIIKDCAIGQIQAYAAQAGDIAVNLGFYADMKHASSKAAYISQNLNMTADDARDLARVLLEAADHADAVRIVREAEAA